jgi:hypothetical protein
MPLFLDLSEDEYYFLVAGRWFRAPEMTGPWSAASSNLPAEFAKIPAGSDLGFVLASIPGTQEAKDAVLLANVPHNATVKISEAKLAVTYDGAPKFVPITGTTMTYAVNTPYQVVLADGQYYCCSQGVWFVAPAASGPWGVCTVVPSVIYTIPPTSPLYNVTYVRVYSTTPTTVVVGYTAGYSGEYVAATGALMFGAGMLTGALLASSNDCCWYGYHPCYYSYGCAAHYNYAYGGYCRAGGAYYGPHGGAGWGAGYNPATGNWSRGGYAYGAHGAAWGSQAYNPFTNTYSAHAGATNGYHSWGASTVSQGNQWASAGHQSGVRGSTGWAENSSGQWAQGAHSNFTNTSVARTGSGDVYAGHDGNVYKQSNGQWQRYSGNGNWEDTSWNRPSSTPRPMSSSATEQGWQNDMQNRSVSSERSSWQNQSASDNWKSSWENRSGGDSGGGWGQHDTQQRLNQDSWGRSRGSSSFGSRFGGGGFGGGGFGGGRFGGFGGGRGRFR